MPPILHQSYSREQAIAAFGSESQSYCDGDFVVVGKDILCIVTLHDAPKGTELSSSNSFTWIPQRIDSSTGVEYAWFPEAVREVYDRSGRESIRIRYHHLFLRKSVEDRYLYLGEMHLGSYGSQGFATFEIKVPVTASIWNEFGSYRGWRVEVNHESHALAHSDIAGFHELLQNVVNNEYSHVALTRYENDTLNLHTNAERGWFMYLREPADSGLYLKCDSEDGDTIEEFQCGCGIALEFPRHQTVSRLHSIELMKEYFQSGKLPTSVEWTEDF